GVGGTRGRRALRPAPVGRHRVRLPRHESDRFAARGLHRGGPPRDPRAKRRSRRGEGAPRELHRLTSRILAAIGLLDGIKRLFAGAKADAEGEVPVATPQGEDDRETSTNAQTAGAADEPWPGND